MSVTINSNYSQFYKGTEQIKAYGSGNAATVGSRKDTIVRYEFNTTDEQGNKVMDRMSREDTFRVMNDISSQYGDNVIVEFSGDGLAALAEHKPLKDVPAQQREIPEGMITYLEGPKQLTEEDLKRTGDDSEMIMKLADPDAYDEYKRLQVEGNKSGTQEGIVSAFKYMVKWYNQKAQSELGSLTKAVEQSRSGDYTTSESRLSGKAEKYLESLRKQYGDYDFIVADNALSRRSLLKQSNKEVSVVFSSSELEKMARDEDYAAEKMRKAQTIVKMSDRICEEFGLQHAGETPGESSRAGTLNKLTISFDDSGKETIFAELEKASEKQQERIEKNREKKAEEKKASEKEAEEKKEQGEKEELADNRIRISAGSEEELLEKFRALNWQKADTAE